MIRPLVSKTLNKLECDTSLSFIFLYLIFSAIAKLLTLFESLVNSVHRFSLRLRLTAKSLSVLGVSESGVNETKTKRF
ncbi:MAG: hypothetical protein ACJAS9_001706 [Polaribacter sp.]|jgi:hypothetical protein